MSVSDLDAFFVKWLPILKRLEALLPKLESAYGEQPTGGPPGAPAPPAGTASAQQKTG